MKNILIHIIFILLLIGCSQSNELPKLSNKKTNIKFTKIEFDKIECENIDASYLGYTNIFNDTLCYIDDKFCKLFLFDKDGNFINKYLSQGGGPNELSTKNIVGHTTLNNNKHFFIGPSNDCYIFNSKYEKISFFTINRIHPKSGISYEEPFYYTLCYPNLIFRNYKENIYCSVYCEHPELNMFTSYSKYIANAHCIAQINITTGNMEKLFGDFPDIYKNNNTKQFSLINFDIDQNGKFYLNFEADSLIYVYDNNFNPLIAFGYEGKKMDKNYSTLSNIREFRNESSNQREKYSYYTWIKYINEKNMLFRSYKKAAHLSNDGLQIYENEQLIGDLNTPKGFKVIGYSEPYFYASVPIDEDNEKITFYKFKLN